MVRLWPGDGPWVAFWVGLVGFAVWRPGSPSPSSSRLRLRGNLRRFLRGLGSGFRSGFAHAFRLDRFDKVFGFLIVLLIMFGGGVAGFLSERWLGVVTGLTAGFAGALLTWLAIWLAWGLLSGFGAGFGAGSGPGCRPRSTSQPT